jgi:5-methylcytosine-specific restriction protein A
MYISQLAYTICKDAYEERCTAVVAIKKLSEQAGLKPNSASMLVRTIFPGLMTVTEFRRTLGVDAFEALLTFIHADLRDTGLEVALKSMQLHIAWMKTKGDSKIRLGKVCETFLQKICVGHLHQIANFLEDEKEQDELTHSLKNLWTKAAIIKELSKLKPKDPERIKVESNSYKRDNKTIAQLKFLRDYKCQICQYQIRTSSGKFYIEAAHINRKADKGPEMPNNILILCPNHHKEFDYCNRDNLEILNEVVIFNMNGIKYSISVKLEQ